MSIAPVLKTGNGQPFVSSNLTASAKIKPKRLIRLGFFLDIARPHICLWANASKLHAQGFSSAVRRSTLAEANERSDWHIGADLTALLIRYR